MKFSSLRTVTQVSLGGGLLLGIILIILVVSYFNLTAISKTESRIFTLRTPSVDASNALKYSVNKALAELRGWMLLHDEQFIRQRKESWKSIRSSQRQLQILSSNWTNQKNVERLEAVNRLLDQFEISQESIEQLAWEESNLPATNLLFKEAVPRADLIYEQISKLIDLEQYVESTPARKKLFAAMANFRGSFSIGLAHIKSFLISADPIFSQKYEISLESNNAAFKIFKGNQLLFDENQRNIFISLSQTIEEFTPLPSMIFDLRRKDNWNLANYELRKTAAPLGAKLILLLEEMTLNQNKLLAIDTKINEENIARYLQILFWLTVLSITTVIVVSMFMKKKVGEPLNAAIENAILLAKRVATGGDIDGIGTGIRTDSSYETTRLLESLKSMAIDVKYQSEQMILAKERAEAATASKTQFLSTMSHEIRTPMNGVIGMTQLMEDTLLTDEQKYYLANITRSGDSLLSIINDILDFSKLDVDKVEIESIVFNLEKICEECMELMAGNSKDKDVEFIFDYEPDCPRYFSGDPSRVRQILMNLIGNASKFTEQGFIRCGVSCISKDGSEEQLRLEVQDTGIGLSKEAIEHLFDEFTQADTTTTRIYGGTGLGLAITKKLVGLMGGVLGVDSIKGEGSTFWIDDLLKAVEPPSAVEFSSLKNVRVLFVDDNKENRNIFKRMLNHMGADATILSDSNEVLVTLSAAEKDNNPYKIAILDHAMPLMGGMELGMTIRMQSVFDELKLLIFSSVRQTGDAALFAKAGFNAYLNKLCRYEILNNILDTMLSHTLDLPIITQHSIDDANETAMWQEHVFNVSILVAEDNLTNQIIAKKLLAKMGVDVKVVNNGQEAVEAFKSMAFELIFMDCQMPVMDGYEATSAIREIEKEKNLRPMPIVALTANASSDDRILCEQSGMSDIVTKPFKKTDLSECFLKWLPN
jgi:signal transduction histidine kinase/CheY-like chemotaxis protein